MWSDEHWTLHPPVGGSLPGSVWLASRVHADSFSDLPDEVVAGTRARYVEAFERITGASFQGYLDDDVVGA